MCDADFVEDGGEGFSGVVPEVAAQGAGVHAGVSCDGGQGQGFTIPGLEVLHDLVDDGQLFVEPVFVDGFGGDGAGGGSREGVEDVEQDVYSGDAAGAGELPDFVQDVGGFAVGAEAQAAGAFFQHGCDGRVFGDGCHVVWKERGGEVQDFAGAGRNTGVAVDGIAQVQVGNVASDEGDVARPVGGDGVADVFAPASGGHDDEFTGVVAVHGPDELREMHEGQGLAGVMDDFSLYDLGGHGAWVPGRVRCAGVRFPLPAVVFAAMLFPVFACRFRFVCAALSRVWKVYGAACGLVNSPAPCMRGCRAAVRLSRGFAAFFPRAFSAVYGCLAGGCARAPGGCRPFLAGALRFVRLHDVRRCARFLSPEITRTGMSPGRCAGDGEKKTS